MRTTYRAACHAQVDVRDPQVMRVRLLDSGFG